MKVDLARELYKSWRDTSRKNRKTEVAEQSRTKVDDPHSLNSVLSELIQARDWRQGIAEGSLFTEWLHVVGPDIGAHSTPISLVDGLLTIQATSTAWATQLTLISSNLLKTISNSWGVSRRDCRSSSWSPKLEKRDQNHSKCAWA